jgi:hypothetical protein
MVIEQSMRWGMSPFAVAQATSVISGRLMFEGKLVAAAVENSGAIVGHMDYAFHGEGEARSITVSATRRGETNPRVVTVELKKARTANEMWSRQPDQQLVYHGARVWARRWTPAVILGVYSREEMGPIIEGQIVSDEAETPAAPPAPPPRVPEPPPNGGSKFEQWMATLEMDLAQAQSKAGVEAIGERTKVRDVLAAADAGIVQAERAARVTEAFGRAYDRVMGIVRTDGTGDVDPAITAADRWRA